MDLKINDKVELLKSFAYIGIPFSIVVTYLGVFSFYIHFGFDVTPFLSFEDITIIYLRYTISSFTFLLVIYIPIAQFINNPEVGFWSKTIGKTKYKRRIFPFTLAFFIILILCIFFETARNIFAILFFSLILFGFVHTILFTAKDEPIETAKNERIEIEFKSIKKNFDARSKYNIPAMISLTFFVMLIAIAVGSFFQKQYVGEKVVIHCGNEILNSRDNPNLMYLGKNSKFIFLRTNSDSLITIIPLEKVDRLDFFPPEH